MTERRDDMWVLAEDQGPLVVEVRSDEEASLLGSYWNAVRRYRDTGDSETLIDFRGESVGGFGLETDTYEIDYWARAGELQFPDIYES